MFVHVILVKPLLRLAMEMCERMIVYEFAF